ncbi:hypothetical protein ACV3J7_22590 [Salmonella enterica]
MSDWMAQMVAKLARTTGGAAFSARLLWLQAGKIGAGFRQSDAKMLLVLRLGTEEQKN